MEVDIFHQAIGCENNLLIIGNGFDLAHSLKTSYNDFLNELKLSSNFHNYIINEEIKCPKKYDKIINSTLVRYLRNTREQNGWIDFENEIRNIISALSEFPEYLERQVDISKKEEYFILRENQIPNLPLFLIYILKSGNYRPPNYSKYKKFLKRDLKDLNEKIHNEIIDFILLFKCYISWINENYICDLEHIPLFENMDVAKVLTFNYTDTYRKVYQPNLNENDVCWVHGRVLDNGNGDIVMGAGSEYYDSKYDDFLDLFKFYQKYKFKTDSQYENWIDVRKESNNFNKIYIYGHSLDSTDKDILKPFFEMNCQIIIYCLDENNKYNLEKNLINILGMKSFYKKVTDDQPNIKFELIE